MKSINNKILQLLSLWCLLFTITILFSFKKGFLIFTNSNGNYVYSTELLSSGGDDFDMFQVTNIFHLIVIIVCLANLIHNNIKKVNRIYCFGTSLLGIIFDLLILWLISLDVSPLYGVFNGDYIMLSWYIVLIIIFIYIILFMLSSASKKINNR